METAENSSLVQLRPHIQERPLCVDLDDTLVHTDTLLESLLLLVKTKPLYLFLLPIWLSKGKAHLKRRLASIVNLDVASLPYNTELLNYLTEEHRKGRQIILATAAESSVAHRVANHLGLFSAVLATSANQNCAGSGKLERIQDYLGSEDFLYAGNGRVDLPIWRSCKEAIIVNASNRLVRTVRKVANVTQIVQSRKNRVPAFIRAIRVHQWVKNLLVLVPLFASHQLASPNHLRASLLAFIAFCLCSSGTYVMNDLLDLMADRRHATKKQRPFACGDLPVKAGLFIVPILLMSGLAVSLVLPLNFRLALLSYLVLTVGYSLYFKRVVILDVILLALLYTIRVLAGGMATDIQISNWLLVFSMFLFLSLALLKRYSELHDIVNQAKKVDDSRGYSTADNEQLASMGSASGYITALVLALYINSDDVRALYVHPQLLWLVCPLILYWISRAWVVAHRGEMDDDPVVFAIKDKASYAVGLITAILFILATG